LSPNDRKIRAQTLIDSVARGEFGVSPRKQGRPAIVPLALTKAIAAHATMMQVSGESEASGPKMTATVIALTHGTKWEGQFNPDYAWRKTRAVHPEILNPVQAKNHEDRRVDWLSFKNINDWTDGVKQYLIDLGMLKDEPGIICEYHLYIMFNIPYHI